MLKQIFLKFTLILMILFSSVFLGCKKADAPLFKCNDSIGCIKISAGDPLLIGVLQALTGKAVHLGEEQLKGIELAVDERKGQLLNHNIILQKEDSSCSSEGGSNAALKISSDPNIVAVIGTTCSGAAASASKIISDAGMVMISGNNSAPFLTSMGCKKAPNWQKGYFRTANNEENAGKLAAIYAFKKLRAKKSATINDGDIYTRGLTQGFEEKFKKLGGKIVLSTTINKGDEDMSPVLEAVKYTKADIIFFPLFQPEGNQILLQARKTKGLENIIMMSDGALIQSSFIEDVKDKGKGMFFVGPSKPETPESMINILLNYRII